MLHEVRGPRRIAVAVTRFYDTAAFVASCRALNTISASYICAVASPGAIDR